MSDQLYIKQIIAICHESRMFPVTSTKPAFKATSHSSMTCAVASGIFRNSNNLTTSAILFMTKEPKKIMFSLYGYNKTYEVSQ